MKPHVDVPDTEMRAAESREETVERVAGGPPHSQRIAADPSSRRHVGVRLSAAAIAVAVATAVLVLMVVLLASGGVGLALGLAGPAALVVAEREDGRIEREVGDGGGGPDEV